MTGIQELQDEILGLEAPPRLTASQQKRLARLIDYRREAAAVVAGLDIEIAIAVGDRDAAQRARKEMEAQVGARHAVREAGCFFDERGAADADQVRGRVANA